MTKKLVYSAIVIAAAVVSISLFAFSSLVVGNPDPNRFKGEIQAFIDEDQKAGSRDVDVVFVGSSSIRGWNLKDSYQGLSLAKRGFGGSHISDVNHYIDRLVLRHSPDIVVFYAGENDISGGKSSDQVLTDYIKFVETTHNNKADTKIIFLSIKPTPKRWHLWADMQEANDKIKAYSQTSDKLYYLDIGTPMLKDSQPNPAVYVPDGIHMTEFGYTLWDEKLSQLLETLD